MSNVNKVFLGIVLGLFGFSIYLHFTAPEPESPEEPTKDWRLEYFEKKEAEQNTKKRQDELSQTKYIGSGRITTVADGVELERVNLWNSTGTGRRVVCTVVKGQRVKIIADTGLHYQVEAVGRDGCSGYCMKGFVVVN